MLPHFEPQEVVSPDDMSSELFTKSREFACSDEGVTISSTTRYSDRSLKCLSLLVRSETAHKDPPSESGVILTNIFGVSTQDAFRGIV